MTVTAETIRRDLEARLRELRREVAAIEAALRALDGKALVVSTFLAVYTAVAVVALYAWLHFSRDE